MKKFLIFTLIIACCFKLQAQTGTLTVINNNTNCTVFVNVMAVAPAEGDGTVCDIRSNGFMVAAGGGTSGPWTPATFASSGPGYYSMTTAIPATTLSSLSDWNWTDVSFQWQCPNPPCDGDGGGTMGETGTVFTGSFGVDCTGGTGTWTGTGCTSATSTWTSSATGSPMVNVTIKFN